MKFHVFSEMEWPPKPSAGQLHADTLDQLVLADSQGYDSAWLAEQHASRYGIGPSLHLAAAQLAARTSRIRIGTLVTLLPFFHPLRLAEEITMLDIMSDGRFGWGIRSDSRHSHARFREQLEIIEKAWRGERFCFDGAFFQIPELECLPTPVQQPQPPIWISAGSDDALKWAGRNDRPLLIDAFSPTHRIEASRGIYREAGTTAGHDVARLEQPVLRQVYVAETLARAREEAAPALLGYSRQFTEHGLDPDEDEERFRQSLYDKCTIIGDAAYCRERISELQERIGLDSLLCWQSFGGLSHEASMASQRRLIEQVAPAFA